MPTKQRFALQAPELPSDAIADPADNTLVYQMWKDGLMVTHPDLEIPPPGFSNFATAQISLGNDQGPWIDAGRRVEVNDSSTLPAYIEVKPDLLRTEGKMYLRLHLELWNTPESQFSDAVDFITDATPPWGQRDPKKITVDPAEVTEAVLSGPGVIVKVPSYDFAAKDRIWVFWASPDGEPVGDPILAQELPSDGAELALPADVIRAAGSGTKWVTYRLADKANNHSNVGFPPEQVKVALGDLATGLQPPAIPLAEDDGMLDLEDARAGVFVHIKPFEHAEPGDTLDLWWGGIKMSSTPTWPFPGNDLQVPVAAAILQQAYGAATGPVATEVAYEVRRGGILMDSRQTTTIQVDYYVGGPVDPDPDWPDPINENLALPVLVPPTSGTENQLTPDDALQDATVTVDLHDDVEVGQILRFYWDDVRLDIEHEVQASEPGTQLSEKVAWTFIEAAGNGSRRLSYRVYTRGNRNYWASGPQSVEVTAVALPGMAFPDLNDRDFLACESLRDATGAAGKVVRVQVPDLSLYLSNDDTLTLRWVPWTGFSGEDPDQRLDKFVLEESVTLGTERPPTGFMWEVPYDPNVKCIYDAGAVNNRYGRGRVSYAYDPGTGPVASVEVEARVTMFMSNDPCQV